MFLVNSEWDFFSAWMTSLELYTAFNVERELEAFKTKIKICRTFVRSSANSQSTFKANKQEKPQLRGKKTLNNKTCTDTLALLYKAKNITVTLSKYFTLEVRMLCSSRMTFFAMLILKDMLSCSNGNWQSSEKFHPEQLSEKWYFHNLQLCSIRAHGTREQEKSQQERFSCPSFVL